MLVLLLQAQSLQVLSQELGFDHDILPFLAFLLSLHLDIFYLDVEIALLVVIPLHYSF